MKPNKGLYYDVRPGEQPEGTYPYGKNGIQYDLLGTISNEPGFKKLALKAPYRVHGAIETSTKPIVFSTNNTNSAVGYLNFTEDKYEPIIDDATWDVWDDAAKTIRSKIGFKLENYIRGQSQKNYKDEMVCVFTDKVLFPMYLNCDNPSIKSVNDLRLFAFFTTPTIDVVMESGGSLAAGAYYVALGYEKNDGTSTAYTDVSNVTIVTSGTIQGSADKVLRIKVASVDVNYQYARVAIISKVGGITKAVELVDYVPITGNTLDFSYTGTELTTDIAVAQVLTKPALYNQVDTIGQLNDYLYIAGLFEERDFDDMQQYATLVKMEWVSELINAINPPTEHISGKKKSLAHEEVYAIYIRYRKIRGGKTKWFTVPGPDVTSNDTIGSSEAQSGGGPATPRFKIEDSIPYYDIGSKSGGFGPWVNETEKYPDTIEFDSSLIGGQNLRGKLVRHHKTPSQRWCFSIFYLTDATYGKSKLDLLGFRALNVKIPDKYKDLIDGYEIGYAIRSVGNMTNYGQGLLLHGTTDHHADGKATDQVPIYTSGGNWATSIFHHGDGNYDNNNELGTVRKDTFRIHPFDVLFNKPSIQPDFISAQWKLRHNQLNSSDNFVMRGQLTGQGPNTGPEAYVIDYTSGETPKIAPSGSKLRHVNKSFYTTGINVENFIGYRHETAFCGYLSSTAGTFWNIATDGAGHEPYDNGTESGRGLKFEEGIVVNLLAIKTDIYQNFYSQTLTSAGDVLPIGDITVLWGGDVFISPYTFHTYGRYNSIDQDGSGIRGFKAARRIVCESVSNINLRYQIPGNIYSNYWPVSPLLHGDITGYLINMDRSLDPNQFGYTKDFNALNDLTGSVIWSPFQEYIYDHPYRIHRGGRASRTGRPRSWRTFLPLDYYELQKNMGHITNLEGMDDRLIIHCENAMFLTQDKSRLTSEGSAIIPITLGSGDIFQFEPQEALSSKLGYAGTQHDLACIRTPFGYIFVDAKMGEIYLYKGKLSLINEGINTFLRDFLKIPNVNTFAGNGITIGWDNHFKRIILTVKNKQLPDGTTVIPFEDTNNFWNTLTPGQIVAYKGRYVQYVGVNNTPYNCVADPVQTVVTWDPVDSFCLTDPITGKLTGILGYRNRVRRINGTLDGYKEPNTQTGLGIYFPPMTNTTACPIAGPTITWKGANGRCLKDDVQTCPGGYTLGPAGCTQVQTQPATPPSGGVGTAGIAAKVNSNQWNNGGARLFGTGYSNTGNGTNQLLTTPHFWVNGNIPFDNSSRNTVDSRMNVAGIWVAGGISPGAYTPMNEYIGFARKITVATARTVFIMMCADNDFKFALNGTVLVDTHPNNGNIGAGPNFSYANIYPVALRAGDNFIEMYAMNSSSVAGFAAEIYDVSLAQLIVATNESQLNIIFSTKDVVGQAFNLGITQGYSCPVGWSLDPSNNTCVKTDVVAPSTASGSTNNGMIHYDLRCRYNDDVADSYCENNTNDGTGTGPYVPDEPNANCLPQTPPVVGTVPLTGSVLITCNDNQCNDIGNAELTFNFASPTPLKVKLLIGVINNYVNTVKAAVGTSIMGTLPVGVVPNGDYNIPLTGAAVPFAVFIPQGTSTITIHAKIYQLGFGVDGTDWKCNNCLYPITDLYLKYDASEQSAGDTNVYQANFSVVNANVTVHNVTT